MRSLVGFLVEYQLKELKGTDLFSRRIEDEVARFVRENIEKINLSPFKSTQVKMKGVG